MKNLETFLGQRIARQRRAVGLTQAQLAEMVSVQSVTISRIELGKRKASLELIDHISDAIEIDLYELFRTEKVDDQKGYAIEKLVRFAVRHSVDEIELIIEIGAAVISHTRRVRLE